MSSESAQTKTIVRSAGTVGIAVFASRILGLVREQVFAAMFGAGFAYDAFVVAYRIPNLLRDLFAEGALSSAFVAVFTDYKTKKGVHETWNLANNVITTLALILGIIVIAGALFAQDIVALIAPEFSRVPGKHQVTVLMTSIMFPFLLLVSLAAVCMGILNTMGKFFIPSIASCFFNLGSILGGVSLAYIFPRFGLQPIVGMAWGVVIGGLLQLIIQIPSVKNQGMRYRPCVRIADPGLLRIMKLMVPAIIGLSATQINIFINTFFAAGCAQGSVSWLNYAFRILWFPIGLVGVSLSVATMPVVSGHASRGDTTKLKEAYISSSVLSLLLSLPATCGLVFLAQPIIRVIFQHGNFTAADTVFTAQALSLYAIGLFAYAAQKITVPVFYALNKTKYPVIGSFITIALNVCIVMATLEQFQYKAIALSTSLCIIVNFLFLNTVLYREIKGYDLGYLCACMLKIIPASLLTGVCAQWTYGWCRSVLGDMFMTDVVSLFTAIGAGIIIYAAAVSALGIREVTQIRKKVLQRLFAKSL